MSRKTKQAERRATAKRNGGSTDTWEKDRAERDVCSMRRVRETSLAEALAREYDWKNQGFWVVSDAAFDRISKRAARSAATH